MRSRTGGNPRRSDDLLAGPEKTRAKAVDVAEVPAEFANRSPEDSFRTPEGPLLYRSHPNSHFVHQKGLSCTKVRGLVVDDERRGDGGFLPSRVRRARCAVSSRPAVRGASRGALLPTAEENRLPTDNHARADGRRGETRGLGELCQPTSACQLAEVCQFTGVCLLAKGGSVEGQVGMAVGGSGEDEGDGYGGDA